MDAGDAGKFAMLVQDTERTLTSLLTSKQGRLTTDQRARIFHRKMLRGDVRGAVRYLTDRGKGGILMPADTDEKSGDSVETVLKSKHPDARTPTAENLQKYTNLPDFVDIDITEDSVEKVTWHL